MQPSQRIRQGVDGKRPARPSRVRDAVRECGPGQGREEEFCLCSCAVRGGLRIRAQERNVDGPWEVKGFPQPADENAEEFPAYGMDALAAFLSRNCCLFFVPKFIKLRSKLAVRFGAVDRPDLISLFDECFQARFGCGGDRAHWFRARVAGPDCVSV